MTQQAVRAANPVVVEVPERFDFAWAVGFLGPRAVSSIERIAAGEYRRSLRVDGRAVTLAITLRDTPAPALLVRSSPALAPEELQAIVRRMFDLTADVEAFRSLAAGDEILAPLVARQPHIRLPQYGDPFEALIRAILGQQVSVAAAATMADRLVRLVAAPAPALDGDAFLAFPSPQILAATPMDALRGIGLTRAKSESVLAAAVAATEMELESLRGMSPEDADARLTSIRGVGPWTAAYLRMRAFGDRDAFPVSDLGIIKAMRREGIERPAEVLERAERWRPWRAYAALHLWESLGAKV